MILVLGFLRIPEVSGRFFPESLWGMKIQQVQQECLKIERKMAGVKSALDHCQAESGHQLSLEGLGGIKRNCVAVERSLEFLEPRLLSLSLALKEGRFFIPAAGEPQLGDYRQQINAMQHRCGRYRQDLEQVLEKLHHLEAGKP